MYVKGQILTAFQTLVKVLQREGVDLSKNLDEQIKVEIMKEYAKTLKRSGYSERFRHEVISDAMRCHQKMLKTGWVR